MTEETTTPKRGKLQKVYSSMRSLRRKRKKKKVNPDDKSEWESVSQSEESGDDLEFGESLVPETSLLGKLENEDPIEDPLEEKLLPAPTEEVTSEAVSDKKSNAPYACLLLLLTAGLAVGIYYLIFGFTKNL